MASLRKSSTIYEIPEKVVASWRRKKLTIYCVNLPAMIGIPAFIELADLETMYAERAETVMMTLSCIDLVFFV
jgi:hypothetical protein